MHQIIRRTDAFEGIAQNVLIEKVAFDDLDAAKSAGEAFGISCQTANGMTGFE